MSCPLNRSAVISGLLSSGMSVIDAKKEAETTELTACLEHRCRWWGGDRQPWCCIQLIPAAIDGIAHG